MGLTELFIRRPVMTATLMISMVFFGVIGYLSLPVANLPQVEYPTIAVNAGLPGADPETVASSLATPLERQFASIEGLRTMSSNSGLGATSINLQFDLAKNIDTAAMDVQAAISRARGDLPDNMPSPPTYRKVNPTQVPVYYLIMSSEAMPLFKVTEYARTFVTDNLTTVPGVAQVIDYSDQKFTVRVKVNPDLLASRQIGINEITNSVVSENVNLPLGTLDGKHRTKTVRASGQLMDAKAYEPVIVTEIQGEPVRLGDLGEVRDGVMNDKAACYFNGKQCIALAVSRQPGSNTVDIVDRIEKKLPAIRASLPPTIKLEVMYDMSKSIRASIDDVKFTLILAVVLVVCVVFFFLRSLAATVVTSIAIPLSIIFTFAVMYFLSFSLDNLSLLALVLAVGFVVDDAIVVLENIVRHMQMGKKPFQAALDGSKQILFTILSMTSSLAIVFVPIMFMAGIYGRILNEFAVTITIAILVSGVVAVCISPMVSSRFLRPTGSETADSGFLRSILNAYRWSLTLAVRHRFITLLFAAAMLAGTIHLFILMPKGFVPNVDMNYLYGISISEQSVSPESMEERIQEVSAIIEKEPGVKSVLCVSGIPQRNQGLMIPILKSRPPRTVSAQSMVHELWPIVNSIPGLITFFQVPPLIQVSVEMTASPYQFIMQSADTETLFKNAQAFTGAMYGIHEISGVNSNLYLKNPEVYVAIDRDKAGMYGLTAGDVEQAFFSSYGEHQISNIYGSTDTYKVIIEVGESFQRHSDQLAHLYIKGKNKELVRLDSIAEIKPRVGPLTVNHYEQLPSVTVSFNTAEGYSLGQATNAVRSLAKKMLPESIIYRFGGTAHAFEQSLKSVVVLLILAIVIIYMILCYLVREFSHSTGNHFRASISIFWRAFCTLGIWYSLGSLWVRRYFHAHWDRQEECHHGGRFRPRGGTSGGQGHVGGSDRRIAGPFSSHHDDHHCRNRRNGAHSHWVWRGRSSSATIGTRCCRWFVTLSGGHPVLDAGRLLLPRIRGEMARQDRGKGP
jgi:HAE1 family hydrophobic/amphiphilic exporter-1